MELVSQDICTHEKKDYLITVCHFSDWIEVDELQDTLAATVISKTKAHFARFGIPQICHTDNGPQFACKEYDDFATQYGFQHTTSSPYHPQGNGRADAAIKVSKSMLKKADDLQTALLIYRNTPPQGHTSSPAQRMLCRRTRFTLPTPDHLLKLSPLNPEMITQELSLKRPRVNNTTTDQHPKHTVLCVSAPASMRNHQRHRRVVPGYVAPSFRKTHRDPTQYKPRITASVGTVSTSSQ